jgi:hypothetical protein
VGDEADRAGVVERPCDGDRSDLPDRVTGRDAGDLGGRRLTEESTERDE